MSGAERPVADSKWRAATWEGARREAMRRWAALPLERILDAQEEMAQLAEELGSERSARAENREPRLG